MSSCTTNTHSPLPGRIAVVSFVTQALAARRQRNALRQLDEASLRDMGLTRREAEREANRPLWDVPTSWRR